LFPRADRAGQKTTETHWDGTEANSKKKKSNLVERQSRRTSSWTKICGQINFVKTGRTAEKNPSVHEGQQKLDLVKTK
jgi:hypothetical protein